MAEPPGAIPARRGCGVRQRGGVYFECGQSPGGRSVEDFLFDPPIVVRRYGLSQRLPSNIDFSKLTPASRILLVHDRAWVDNCADFAPWTCPKGHESHAFDQEPPMCSGVWWEDVRDVAALAPGIRHVRRQMPAFDYEARRAPDGVEGRYRQAFFASFPCSRLAVVKGSPKTQVSKEAAQKSTLPVVEVTQ